MIAKNRLTVLIDDCVKTFAAFGHKLEVPNEFLDPISKQIMELPIELAGANERFDLSVLVQTSTDIHLMDKTFLNPLTKEPATSFQVDESLQKQINMFVTGMTMLANEFKAKISQPIQADVN